MRISDSQLVLKKLLEAYILSAPQLYKIIPASDTLKVL